MQECHPTNFYDHTGARRSENSKMTHCLKFVVRAPKRNNQQVASHEKSAAITRCYVMTITDEGRPIGQTTLL